MSTVKERLLRFIQEIGISTAEFERNIGVSGGYVSNISKSIQPDKLEIISNLYPQLSIEWLLIERGSMLTGDTSKLSSPPIGQEKYNNTIRELEAEIIALKAENKVLRELAGLGERKDSNKSA